MTTIVTDGKEMSCDLQFSHSNGLRFKGFSKILELSPKTAEVMFGTQKAIVGACGNADSMALAWEFLANPGSYKKIPKLKGAEFVAITPPGSIMTSADLRKWISVEQPYYAIGSGCHIAMGAMSTGTSTKKAIDIASKHDPMTGMGVKTYKL